MKTPDEEPYDEVEDDVSFGRLTLRPQRPRAECPYCGKAVALRETGRLWYHGHEPEEGWCSGSGEFPP